jgi:hypothetical protein
MTQHLRRLDLDWIINIARVMGFKKILQLKAKKLPPISAEVRSHLHNVYAQDINNLETVLEINLDVWRDKK